MHGFLRLSLFLLCTHISISSMQQLTRLAGRTVHHAAHIRHYASTKPVTPTHADNVEHKEAKRPATITEPTIINYKGKKYTPAEFAQYALTQGAAKGTRALIKGIAIGMDFVKQCTVPEDIACACIKPYMVFAEPSKDDWLIHHISPLNGAYNECTEAMQKLSIVSFHFQNNISVTEQISSMQHSICPHAKSCLKKLVSESVKKPFVLTTVVGSSIFAPSFMTASGGFLSEACLTAGLVALISSGLTFIASRPYKSTRKQAAALIHYLNHQTTVINTFLETLKPLVPDIPKHYTQINMNTADKCLDPKENSCNRINECVCIKPYLIVAALHNKKNAYLSDVREKYIKATEQLAYTLVYFRNNAQIMEQLISVQQSLCPHVVTRYHHTDVEQHALKRYFADKTALISNLLDGLKPFMFDKILKSVAAPQKQLCLPASTGDKTSSH